MTAGITWSLAADLDRDGTFETALAGYVSAAVSGTITAERGTDRNGSPTRSTLRVIVENVGGEFSRRNLAGTFSARMRPGFPIRVTATHAGADYSIWTGYATNVRTISPLDGLPSAEIEADGLMGRLGDADLVYVTASSSRAVGTALEAIRAAAGVPAADAVDFDTGVALPWHFASAQNPYEALAAAVNSEMGGSFYERADGVLRFENRRRRRGVSQWDLEALADAPVALWRFREATGSTVYDLSGNGRDLALAGSPARAAAGLMTPHDPAMATTFDGVDDVGTIADAAALAPTAAMTWTAIILWPAVGQLAAGVMERRSSAEDQGYVMARPVAGGDVEFVLNISGTDHTLTWPAPSAGVAYHVWVEYDGTAGALYVDNVLIDSFTAAGAIEATGTGTVYVKVATAAA